MSFPDPLQGKVDLSPDILLFYSKSKDLPVGSYEKGRKYQEQVTHPTNYLELNAIPNWRKVLSNFYVFEFTIEVSPDTILTFRSIEHGFHYFKIRLADTYRAFDFALESGSKLSKGDGLDARRARKLVVLTSQQLQQWDSIKESVLYSLSKCRYSQDPLSKQVLLATRDAQLWHIASRSAPNPHTRIAERNPIRFAHLERVREELQL
jgi:hypothetical protein